MISEEVCQCLVANANCSVADARNAQLAGAHEAVDVRSADAQDFGHFIECVGYPYVDTIIQASLHYSVKPLSAP